MTSVRAVFLDRDGVISRAIVRDGRPYAPTSLAEFEILDGVGEALGRLHDADYKLILATNQPDVARGKISLSEVEQMHQALSERFPIDEIMVCYQEDGPDCHCYKPKPGMLLDAAKQFGVDLKNSFMIGDRWRDVGAGHNAGCHTIFIERGYREELRHQPDWVCGDLGEAAEYIMSGPWKDESSNRDQKQERGTWT